MDIHQNQDHSTVSCSDYDVGQLPKNQALFMYLSLQTKGLMPYMVEESPGVFRVGYITNH
jgi:hypothetical protein